MRLIAFILSIFLSLSAYADQPLKFNLTRGVTPISRDIYDLHMTVLGIVTLIGVFTFGALIYALIKHRKSRGHKPAQFHGSTWVEVIWTTVPFLILIALAIPATIVLIRTHDDAKSDINIKVIGYQWKWKYEYLDQGISFFSNLSTPQDQIDNKAPKGKWYLLEVDKPLVVPIHKKIRFLVTSNDVNHSWWVPDLGIKRDAIPGFVHEAWARIDKPGIYRGQCAELCGMRHGFMPIVIVAMTNADFEKWVAKQKKVAPAADQAVAAPKDLTKAELMQLGKKTYLAHCSVCHKPDGKGMPPAFPALKGDETTTGPVSAHIQIVLNGKKGTAMQAFKDQLSTQEIAAVVTYERNAWGNDNKQKYGKDAGGLIQPVDVLKEQGVKIGPPASAASKPEGEKEKPKAAIPETSKPEAKKEKPKAATPEVSKPDVEKEKATPQPVQSAAMTKDQLMELGKKVYLKHCSVCHQPNGQGMPPAFPTMVGSKITTGPVAGHINIVLYGKKGTTMQAFQEQLTDKEIAAVVTYERNSWGNDDKQKYGKEAGGLIQPADVVKAKG